MTPTELLEDIPELKAIARVDYEEIANVGSGGVTTEMLLKLAKDINAALASPDCAGAVRHRHPRAAHVSTPFGCIT